VNVSEYIEYHFLGMFNAPVTKGPLAKGHWKATLQVVGIRMGDPLGNREQASLGPTQAG
jgi:hypothetical protein